MNAAYQASIVNPVVYPTSTVVYPGVYPSNVYPSVYPTASADPHQLYPSTFAPAPYSEFSYAKDQQTLYPNLEQPIGFKNNDKY